MDTNGIILFYTTSAAFQTEKLLLRDGMYAKLKPIPRHLSSDCGVCLFFDSNEQVRIQKILKTERVEYDRIHVGQF